VVSGGLECGLVDNGSWDFGSPLFEHPSCRLELGGRVCRSVQPVVADLDESPRQDVLKEAPDEHVGGKKRGPVALGPEEDVVVGESKQALVGEADAVSVATQVAIMESGA
jgi:hypothetical protein